MLDEADQLYGLALEEFTEARDALAKRLRADKRREDADAVHALRKPSVAAWAINQAVRGHRDEADELLAAGAGLRKAHQALLGGGDRAKAREASECERDAVRALTRRALDALGERASDPTAEKIRATLHAVATDEDLRAEVQAGRLKHESEGGASAWPGASGDDGETAPPRRAAGECKPAAEPRSAPREPPERRRSNRASGVSDSERRRIDAAKRAQHEAERAQEVEADADAAAESARKVLAEAEEAAHAAREKAEVADAAERAARRGVKEAEAQAERRRTEARRAVKAARARS